MLTTSAELEELIDSVVTIPTIPTTLVEINNVLSSPDGSARDAGDVIEKDPAIATKVLRLVNSSFYSLANPVNAIHLACSILGLKVIKNIVVQATVLESFSDVEGVKGFNPDWLWDHSFKTAMAARLLVKASPSKLGLEPDEAYTCGLVHDIGKMLLLESAPDRFGEALEHSRAHGLPLARSEAEMMGFTHAHVAGLLAQRWNLAQDLQAAVMYHHSPGGEPEQWARGFLIHCANSIAHEAASGNGGYAGQRADSDSMELLGVPAERLNEIREEVRDCSMSSM